MFAVVFTSFRLSFAWATMIAIAYAGLSLVMERGVDFEIKEEKVLFTTNRRHVRRRRCSKPRIAV